jgi:hypothetical protein
VSETAQRYVALKKETLPDSFTEGFFYIIRRSGLVKVCSLKHQRNFAKNNILQMAEILAYILILTGKTVGTKKIPIFTADL